MWLKVLVLNIFLINIIYNFKNFLNNFYKNKKLSCKVESKFMFDIKEKKLKDYIYKRITKICFNKQGDKNG